MLVWNINGLTERKLNDSDFVSKITENDIIFLSESWTDKSSNIELNDFTCYNFYRKFKHRKAKRNSGGIVIYVRNTIKTGISIAKNHYDTLVWLKLDKDLFGFQNNIFICGLYMWSDESPAAILNDIDVFNVLAEDIAYYEQFGSVLLAGD